jgi:AraC-type DNA-binding domain-containing proteins
MEDTIPLYLNTALVITCWVFAIVFFAFPLPPDHRGLKYYRISLRTLALGYFLFGSLIVLSIIIGEPEVDLLSIINLNIASLQAVLFTMALVILMNPAYVTKRRVMMHVAPIVLLDVIEFVLSLEWGNPNLDNISGLGALWCYPTVVVREVFLLFFVAQLVYLTRIFMVQTRLYASVLNNYFSEGYRVHIPWVQVCFYSSLTLGVLGVFMMCFFSLEWEVVFTFCCLAFYFIFGICYIQYPRTFLRVESAIQPVIQPAIQQEVSFKINRKISWSILKTKIMREKYYTRMGVNIEEMAQYLNVGRTTLSGLINKEENVNFNAWIGMLRVDEAIRIFNENPEYTIAQVSEMVGYSEPSNFSRQFKNIIGQSPSEWCQQKRILA